MNGCVYRTADNKCEFWSDHGDGIVSYCDFDNCENKKPSRAERIRSMTDEELAEFFVNAYWHICKADADECLLPSCKQCILDWLKQEAHE